MRESTLKVEALNALLSFLPRFEEKDDQEGKTDSPAFLICDKDVKEFIEMVEQNFTYLGQEEGFHKLDQNISKANYQELLFMLKIAVRVERVREGTVRRWLEGGQIQTLLRRLKALQT